MRVNNEIKIREEDGFFLLINLSSDSIIKGFPSFFKVNGQAINLIQDIERHEYSRTDLLNKLVEEKGLDEDQIREVEKFLSILVRFDILYE